MKNQNLHQIFVEASFVTPVALPKRWQSHYCRCASVSGRQRSLLSLFSGSFAAAHSLTPVPTEKIWKSSGWTNDYYRINLCHSKLLSCYLDSVSPALHLRLQATLLLTFLAQPLLQLLLLLPHALNTSLQLQHSAFALSREVSETSSVPLTLAENLIQKHRNLYLQTEKIKSCNA